MLSAFIARPIVELKQRDKSKIEAILAHGDRLLVGLSTGSLRIYRVNEEQKAGAEDSKDGNGKEEDANGAKSAELLREQEKFSKYKIDQLAVIREANILISLSNASVSIHDLGSYELQEQLTKTKGATAFAVTSYIVKDDEGVPGIVSRLAVAVKRRLLLWTWHDMELSSETTEITLAHSIRTLTWSTGTKILCGLSTTYAMVEVETQDITQIVGPGAIGGGPDGDNARVGVGMGAMNYMGMGLKEPSPLATRLGEKEMLLAKDINSHFINRDGEAIGRRQIPWRVAPEAVGYSYPYMLALQESSRGVLEVRNPETLTLLQSISLPGANLLQVAQPNISLAHAGKGFLVASERTIWQMSAMQYDSQIDALVTKGWFDEAISLLGMLEETLIYDKDMRLRSIKMQKAAKLFREKNFRDSLDLFGQVMAPPVAVIKLYPKSIAGDIVEEEDKNRVHTPTDPPGSPVKHETPTKRGIDTPSDPKEAQTPVSKMKKAGTDDKSDAGSIIEGVTTGFMGNGLAEKDLRPAVRELQAYLADVRRRLQRFFAEDQTIKPISEFGDEPETRQTLRDLLDVRNLDDTDVPQKLEDTATLVDTTLFRAHMYATPSLAGSLFRIANHCDAGVVMQSLEESNRHSELIDFLNGKRLHRSALERLQKFGKSKGDESEEALRGTGRTIRYLQSLPPELIDLILEFAEWPIRTDPEQAMEIFIGDTENARYLPREKVLTFLEKLDSRLALRYLEHAIDELNDATPDLHQKLVTLYLEQIKKPADSDVARKANVDKFLTLLRQSTQYSPPRLLDQLPSDNPDFYEARAVVLNKMGRHRQALEIYVFKLKDVSKAEEYCNRVHLSADPSTQTAAQIASRKKSTSIEAIDEQSTIYNTLLNLYLSPPPSEQQLWQPAIQLLAKHGSRLPASSTLEVIPKALPVKELEFYFRGRVRSANTVTNDGRVEAGLRKVQAVMTETALLLGEGVPRGARNRKVKVDEDRMCTVCFKRLGNSVISVFPDNSVVHLGCANRKQIELAARA